MPLGVADSGILRRAMRRLLPLALTLVLLGCDDEPEMADDPPLAVPNETVPENPVMPPPGMAMPTAGATTEFDPPLAVPNYETLPDPPPPQMPPGMQPTGAPVPLSAGFQPDPVVQSGISGGPVGAMEFSQNTVGCAGYVAPQPNHVMNLMTPFQLLRVLVNSQQDTTLVIRGSDGVFYCNDDREELNPIVEGPFHPGVYQIFVGSYQPSINAPYAIGFTEIPQVTCAQLAGPPPGGAMPPGAGPPMQPQ